MSKKSILIFGGAGMLGSVFCDEMKDCYDITSLSKNDADIRNFASVLTQISMHEPEFILNFAAMTDVEWAEIKHRVEAFEINALGAQNVAKAAWAFGIPLVYISSDYVFDGENERGYTPDNTPNPINNYWVSKYLGEELTKREYSDAIIVRTSALYGGPLFGNPWARIHFINKILEKNSRWEPLDIVNNHYTLPTSCRDFSQALGELIESIESYEGEILHLVSENNSLENVSWYDFVLETKKYFSQLGEIHPLSINDSKSRVQRPKYGILKNTSNIHLPDWRESLKKYLKS